MRLAFVSTMYAFSWGGSEELWADAARAALADGHEVHLFLYRWPEVPERVRELESLGARVHLRARHDTSLMRLSLMHAAMRSAALPIPAGASAFRDLARIRPDVVCVSQGDLYSGVRENVALVRWLRASRTPYVVICQFADDNDMLRPFDRGRARSFLGGARRVLFVAEGNRRTAERQLASRLPHARVARNPVNLVERSPVPWPAGERVELACVAKLAVYAKGQDALLEALSQAPWTTRDWRLNLYGRGADERYLRDLAALYGLSSRVVFHGHVTDIRQLWTANHLLVLPSRAEGIPLALVEAMLCARPAVVTDVAGHPEWVEEERTGWLAAACAAPALRSALERAWQARARWPEMGRRAHLAAGARVPPEPGRDLLAELLGSVGAEAVARPVLPDLPVATARAVTTATPAPAGDHATTNEP